MRLAVLALVVASGAVAAEERKGQTPARPLPSGSGVVLATPSEPAAVSGGTALVSDRPHKTAGGSDGSGPDATLVGMRASNVADGEARLDVGGVPTMVRVGSVIGTDVVTSIVPGRILLRRPASPTRPGGEGLVIVTFDDSGAATVRVLWTANPTPVRAPAVH